MYSTYDRVWIPSKYQGIKAYYEKLSESMRQKSQYIRRQFS